MAPAAALGPPRPEFFDEAFFLRPDLATSAQAVRLEASDAITRAYPDHYGARVTLTRRRKE